MIIVFICGYAFGKNFSPVSVAPLAETITLPAKPELTPAAPEETPAVQTLKERKAAFKSLMDTCSNHANDLQVKISGIARIAAYLRKQTEEAEKARSLEESLVYEARYRESLSALLALEQDLCAMLSSALEYAKDYTHLLEGHVWGTSLSK